MTFELFTKVALKRDVPEWNLREGDLATVVDTHQGPPGMPTGYSLEVFNVKGDTVAVICLSEDEIAPLEENEVYQVRKFFPVSA